MIVKRQSRYYAGSRKIFEEKAKVNLQNNNLDAPVSGA